MTQRNQYISLVDQFGIRYYQRSDYLNSVNSTRDPLGRLVLRSNPLTRWKSVVGRDMNHIAASRIAGNMALYYPPISGRMVDGLLSESYAKFRGKLYEGSAALGVTLGTYKESREMIVTRSNQLTAYGRVAEVKAKEALTSGRFGKKLASTHLEAIFGWAPLLSDIHAATLTLCQGADVNGFVRSRATGYDLTDEIISNRSINIDIRQLSGYKCRVTRAARVTITNPNRWLLERAGLLNPAAVAWDLVPWSWAIGMFVNTGQLVNSLTDFAGLTFSEQSTTINSKGFRDRNYIVKRIDRTENPPLLSIGQSIGTESATGQEKKRSLTATSLPPLTFRVPDANWETAAMAASLMVQQMTRLSRLASLFNLSPRK